MTVWEIPAQGQLLTWEQVSTKPELGQFYFEADPVLVPFEAIGLDIDRKKINLDEDNQEETIILRRLPNDKIILEISDGAGRFRWSERLEKKVSGSEEIRDIADINGDGMLEIVVEEAHTNCDTYVEIFTYNKNSSRKIFAAEGFNAWNIQGAGKEIILEEKTQVPVQGKRVKIYRWLGGRYKMIRSPG